MSHKQSEDARFVLLQGKLLLDNLMAFTWLTEEVSSFGSMAIGRAHRLGEIHMEAFSLVGQYEAS